MLWESEDGSLLHPLAFLVGTINPNTLSSSSFSTHRAGRKIQTGPIKVLMAFDRSCGERLSFSHGKFGKVHARSSRWNGTGLCLSSRECGGYIQGSRGETMVLETSNLWVLPSPAGRVSPCVPVGP